MSPLNQRENNVNILDKLFWSVQPKPGIISGDYYKEENWFAPHFDGDKGYHGILEVVQKNGRIQLVEFNEINSETYYIKMYQGVSKRLSNYGFFQATKERTANTGVVLVNGFTHLEDQMIAENRLTGDFDLLAGASNSIKRSMLLLAERIDKRLSEPSGQKYFGIAESLGGGITGRLQVVTENRRIINCFYDEIFSDTQEEISEEALKPYYRQSKYHSLEYISTAGVGFNIISDNLNEYIQRTQQLLNLNSFLFFTENKHAQELDNYLLLAGKLEQVLKSEIGL